jgi:hypothetical protein
LWQARRKTLQVSLATAQHTYMEGLRRQTKEDLKGIRAHHRGSGGTMGLTGVTGAATAMNFGNLGTITPGPFGMMERNSMAMQTIQDVLADADLETEMIGEPIHSTEVPISEGVLNVKVCKTDEEVRTGDTLEEGRAAVDGLLCRADTMGLMCLEPH